MTSRLTRAWRVLTGKEPERPLEPTFYWVGETVHHYPDLDAASVPVANPDGVRAELFLKDEQLPTFGRKLRVTCDASTQGIGGALLGPCILRDEHEGPVHQDVTGARWSNHQASMAKAHRNSGAPVIKSHVYEGDGGPCTADLFNQTCGEPRLSHTLLEGDLKRDLQRARELLEEHDRLPDTVIRCQPDCASWGHSQALHQMFSQGTTGIRAGSTAFSDELRSQVLGVFRTKDGKEPEWLQGADTAAALTAALLKMPALAQLRREHATMAQQISSGGYLLPQDLSDAVKRAQGGEG